MRSKQLRRLGYAVAGFAAFVLVLSVVDAMSYASFAERALDVDARIVSVERIADSRQNKHLLRYVLVIGEREHSFEDRGQRDSPLEDLYAGTANAFTGPDAPLAPGKTFAVLVDPKDPGNHRPNRDKLAQPWVFALRSMLGVAFLSAIAAFLLWSGRAPRTRSLAYADDDERGEPQTARPRTLRSEVSTSRNAGVVTVRASLDVPWAHAARAAGPTRDALQARMRELRGDRAGTGPDPIPQALAASETGARTLKVSMALRVHEPVALLEARVDLLGAQDERQSHALGKGLRWTAGESAALHGEFPIPSIAVRARLTLVLDDQRRWEHEIAL